MRGAGVREKIEKDGMQNRESRVVPRGKGKEGKGYDFQDQLGVKTR